MFSLEQNWHLRTSSFDSVIFDQAVRSYAHLHLPIVPVKGVHSGLGAHFDLLGDHFSPIIALLAPLYWIHADVPTLLVAQAVLFAASIPIVWLATRRALGPAASYPVAAAYALSFGLQSALATDFHEIAFAVPLIALAIERALAGRVAHAVLAAAVLLLVKEDLAMFVCAFGIYLAVRGWRWIGVTVAVAGIVAFEVETKLLIPYFGGHPFAYWSYGALGPNLPDAAWYVLTHPLDTLRIAVHPAVKRATLLWTFAPWGFLAVASPLILLAGPLLAERLLSARPHYWTTGWHYSATLMPVVTLASVDGLARLLRGLRVPGRRRPPLGAAAGVAALVVAVAAIPHFAFGVLFTRSEWQTTPAMRAAAAALRHVPSGVTVEAASPLGPHLTRRDTVLLLDQTPRGAPWVVINVARHYFPFRSAGQARARYRWLLAHGYRLVASDGAIRVLHRP